MFRLKCLAVIMLLLSAVSYGQGGWFTNYNAGLEEAKKRDKDLLIYFYSDHCPFCLYMEEFVLGDPEVDSFINENYVVVSLDVGDTDLTTKFGAYGVPYFVFYDPKSDRILMRIYGSREREDFLNLLIRACKKSSLRRC